MTPRQLRAIRHRLGLTQDQLADQIGVAANTVARWERGEMNMRTPTARLITMLAQNTDLTRKLKGTK
jgi:transcriptional regulator with XRE-family HTH domain